MYSVNMNGFTVVSTQNVFQKESKANIDYYKKKLQDAKDKERSLREKIKKLHFKSYQLSLLINKKTSEKLANESSSKPPSRLFSRVIPPLAPKLHENEKELQSILFQSEPEALLQYFRENSIIEELFFFSKSIFDESLETALTHASPDTQVLFFDKLFESFQKISDFIDKIMPFITDFTTSEEINSYLLDPDSPGDNFMEFYNKTLSKIAEVIGCSAFKVVYLYEKDESLFYPSSPTSQIIDISNSLSGHLIYKEYDDKTDYKNRFTFIEDPFSDMHYSSVSESCIFDGRPILSLPISFSDKFDALAIFVKEKYTKFTKIDMLRIQASLLFCLPVLSIFKIALTNLLPRTLSLLVNCITRLREGNDDLFTKIGREACRLTTASICRVLVVEGAENDFPELEIIPPDSSLIRSSYESNALNSIKLPRSIQGFNMKVDNAPGATKISAMLIVPVRTLPLMLVLYNPSSASEFTSTQCALIKMFSDSLPPLLHQNKVKKQLNIFVKSKQEEINNLEKIPKALKELTKNIGSSDFLDIAAKYLGCSIQLFFFIDEDYVAKFPTGETMEISENMNVVTPTLFTDGEFDVESEANGDTEVKCIVVYPFVSINLQKCFFILSSNNEEFFNEIDFDSDVSESNDSLFLQLLRTVLLLTQTHILSFELSSVSNTIFNIQEAMVPSDEKMSLILNSKVSTIGMNSDFHAPTIASAMNENGDQIIVTCDKELSTNESELLDAYAEWVSIQKTFQDEEEDRCEVVVSALTRNGIHKMFQCDIIQITDFLNWCSSRNADSSVIMRVYHTCNTLLGINTWRSWFTKEEKNIIFILSILYGTLDKWIYVPDEKTLKATECLKPSAVKYGAILFGTDGIGEEMDENAALLLKESLNDYAILPNERDEVSLISHIRMSSLNGFKPSPFNKEWIGKAIVVISQSTFIINESSFVADEFNEIMDDDIKQRIIFKNERLIIPLLTYISIKNSTLTKWISNIREALKLVRGK